MSQTEGGTGGFYAGIGDSPYREGGLGRPVFVRALRRSGMALALVAGCLALMGALSVCFVTMVQMERKAATQRLFASEALLLARSGLEDAAARSGAGQDALLAATRYQGEDWNADGAVNAGAELDGQAYRPSGVGTAPDTDLCPASCAQRPSFFRKAGTAPRLDPADGRLRGSTGALSTGRYALKAVPEGGIYLNGGDPAQAVAAGNYNETLRRMFSVLAEAVDREDGAAGDGPVSSADGQALVDLRPASGWRDWDQVRTVALGGSQAKLDALKPYLALHAWVDLKVIRPNAAAAMSDVSYASWGDIKLAHETYPSIPGTRTPDFERIPVLPSGRLVGRAPVDLAWARTRRPVLIALMAGLKGLFLDEGWSWTIAYGDMVGRVRSAEIPLDWAQPSDPCRNAAAALQAYTGPLATWQDWNAFCDTLTSNDLLPTASTDAFLLQARRDVLKANFNPNSQLNKFNPDASRWRTVDKSDLLVYSTEFGLSPTAPALRCECAGVVLGPGGKVLATRTARASLAPCPRLVLTTQREFVCDLLGNPSRAGDETSVRLPGQSPFISRSAGTGKTWGHALGIASLGGMGVSLQTLPEPCVNPGGGLAMAPADWDGSVQLATVETLNNAFYLVTCTTQDMKFLARYSTTLDLDVADGTGPPFSNAAARIHIPDTQQVTYTGAAPDASQLSYSVLHGSRPNTLYPDGAYSEKGRQLSYLDRGNANGFQGVMSFWIKANHLPPVYMYVSRGHPYVKWTNFAVGGTKDGLSSDQHFTIGTKGFQGYGIGVPSGGGIIVDPPEEGGEEPALGASLLDLLLLGEAHADVTASSNVYIVEYGELCCQYENAHDTADAGKEHRFQKTPGLRPHRWHLVTFYYDQRSPLRDDCGELVLDEGTADPLGSAYVQGLIEAYDITYAATPSLAADFTLNDRYGAHRIMLGGGRYDQEFGVDQYMGSGAEATFDEFAIYNFGGAGPAGVPAADSATKASPSVLGVSRWKEGRYYKESDYYGLTASPGTNRAGEYFSPRIDLGSVRIRSLVWTQTVPRGLRAPLPAGGKAGVDGEPGKDATVLFEISDLAGTAYLQDASGMLIDRPFELPSGSPVDRRVSVPFRLHAVFQPNLQPASLQDTPVLDPLSLDDLTVFYELPEGRRFLAWSEGD